MIRRGRADAGDAQPTGEDRAERPAGAPEPATQELPELLAERPRRLHVTWRVLALIGGALFMTLGMIGWLVPVVTGIPFYIIGLGLFGMGSRRARRWINRLEQRLPTRARLFLRPKLRKALRAEDRGGDPDR